MGIAAVAKKEEPSLQEFLARMIDISGKSQRDIARDIGYKKPNMVSMMKTGDVNIPLQKIGPLAKAIGADPAYMMRLALKEYQPENWEAIQDQLDPLITENERKLISAFREATNNTDPNLSNEQIEDLKNFIRSIGGFD